MPNTSFDRFLSNINPPHYALIGKIAVNWAALEALINSAIWRVARVEDRLGACITSQIVPIHSRIDALIALVELRGGSAGLCKELRNFSNSTHGISQKRNRIIHDAWHIDNSTNILYQLEITAKSKPIFRLKQVEIEELESTRESTVELIDRFDEIFRRVIDELGPLIEILPLQSGSEQLGRSSGKAE